MTERVLIIDDDRPVDEALGSTLTAAGLLVETVDDGFAAIEKLRREKYSAVILDPMIRQRLNGYAVLSFIELEQPETLDRLFLLTGMSAQTIARTAPNVLSRLFRKPSDASRIAHAIIALSDRMNQKRQRSRQILLIEDDFHTANAMESMAQELGYEVTVVHSGRQALECLTTSDYAVILLDLVLPDLDGFAVLEHLQKIKPDALRHLIVTTGMPERYVADIDRHQICALVQKPIHSSELGRLLNRCEEEAR